MNAYHAGMARTEPHVTANDDAARRQHVRRLREPFAAANRRIVAATLARFVDEPGERSAGVEINAGDGQLRDWLPEAWRDSVMLTEPAADAFAQIQQRHGDASCHQAAADALPCDDASLDVVLGLCVYDGLPEPLRARDEICRVLRPGGCFAHFLDMGVRLEPLLATLAANGETPLPNFLAADVAARHLSAEQAATLPATDPLDDLIITKRDEFAALIAAFDRVAHPLAATLAALTRLCTQAEHDPAGAAASFAALLADASRLAPLNEALLSLYLALNERNADGALPFTVSPFATWKYLRSQLESHFDGEAGFEVELSAVVTARGRRQRDATTPDDVGYVARLLGRTVTGAEPPQQPWGTPAESLHESGAEATTDQHDETALTVESGMYIFVARKR